VAVDQNDWPVKVGVRLPRHPEDLGGWLATGAAFDAAGADALWVDVAPEAGLDALALTAALAALTARSLLVLAVPRDARYGPETLATVGRLSHGRLRHLTDSPPAAGQAGAFRRAAGDAEVFADGDEHWVVTALPGNRAAWREMIVGAAERRTHGLIFPAHARLLDLLRNPEDPGQRRDLELAVG
jgi:hypothetical protein